MGAGISLPYSRVTEHRLHLNCEDPGAPPERQPFNAGISHVLFCAGRWAGNFSLVCKPALMASFKVTGDP